MFLLSPTFWKFFVFYLAAMYNKGFLLVTRLHLISLCLSKEMEPLHCSLVLFTCSVDMQPTVHGLHRRHTHLHQLCWLQGVPMATGSSLMITVKHIFGFARILLQMLRWCPGGIMGTRSPPWETELSLLTIIPGITHTLLLLDEQCHLMKMKHTK